MAERMRAAADKIDGKLNVRGKITTLLIGVPMLAVAVIAGGGIVIAKWHRRRLKRMQRRQAIKKRLRTGKKALAKTLKV